MKKVLLLFLSLFFLNNYNLSANSNLPPCEGEDHENYTNCYGKYIGKQYEEEDGLKYLSDYEGEFGKQPGLSHGYGKAKLYSFNSPDWDDEEYEGNFKNDYYHGQGTLTTPAFIYIGGWKEGLEHGYGELTFKDYKDTDSTKFSGKFNQGKIKKGIKTYSKGIVNYKYEGGFNSNFQYHGDGVFTENNSNTPYILKAKFKNDTPNGKGKIIFTKHNISYEGNWTSWTLEKGLITKDDGQTYQGEIKNWQPHGKGLYYDAEGKSQRFWDDNKELAKQEIEREMEENQRKAEERRIQEMYVEATKLRQRVARCYVKYSLQHFSSYLDAIENYKRIRDYDGMIYLSKKFLSHPQVPGDC
tara:strand:+ start:1104 stop:2171 length:1068 start_codon:yes stop_codon:yes gene_type:complete